jgi:hypothetical protein
LICFWSLDNLISAKYIYFEVLKRDSKFWAILVIAIILGLIITWVDSLPNWDDTGISATLIFIVAGLTGFIYPLRPFIWALAVSVWIPLLGIIVSNNYSSLLALLFGFAGAYLGSFIKNNL